MRSFKILDRRTGNRLASIALIIGTLVPSLIPALVSASTVTSRSVTMSSSAADAASADYDVKFTIPSTGGTAAGAFVVDFCSDSPLVGQTCTAPVGLNTTSVSTDTSGVAVTAKTASALSGKSAVIVEKSSGTWATGTAVDVNLTTIHNPTAVGTFYARIVTYADAATADSDYTDTDIGAGFDDGGVALSTTSDIGVNAAVRETLTFCVASASITSNCANASTNLPSFEIGEGSAGQKALTAGTVSTANIYTLLSTNASSGAVVKLRSNTTDCGGLVRAGATNCDIKAADNSTVIVDTTHAGFGIKAAAATGTGVSGGTSGNLAPTNGYGTTAYKLNYTVGNTAGVTSPYGDDLLNTGGHQVSDEQLQLTFGASITNLTPAGLYKATLNMIATGTY
jgi:hypothetical protein